MTQPLVTIGIPTFNRASRLRRAAESALAQTCADIELIISDNCSPDETEPAGRELAARDQRVRYVRQPENRGPVANFNFVREQAAGQYFMWLSDDDWIEPAYVARCVETLDADTGCSLVAGLPRYYDGERHVRDDRPLNLLSDSPARRMLTHYYTVESLGAFYGLMRREQAGLWPLPRIVGCDWLLVGALAFLGRVRTLDDVCIHRGATGVSRSFKTNAGEVNGSRFQARHAHLSVALAAMGQIATSPIFRTLGPVRRAGLAAAAFAAIYLARTRPARWLFSARRRIWGPLKRGADSDQQTANSHQR